MRGSRTALSTSSCTRSTYGGSGPPPITLCTPRSTGFHHPTGRPKTGRVTRAGSGGLTTPGIARKARYNAGIVPIIDISTGGQAWSVTTATSVADPAVAIRTARAIAACCRAPAGPRESQSLHRFITVQIHHEIQSQHRFCTQQPRAQPRLCLPAARQSGVYSLTFVAKNKLGAATQAFTLTVTRAPVIKKIHTATIQTGSPATLTITASGYPTPALAQSGTLPSGITFTDNGNGTAVISGTPAADSGGNYLITVTATNASGTTRQVFTLKVN